VSNGSNANDHRKTISVSKMLKELDLLFLENRCKAARLTTLYKIRKGAGKANSKRLKPAPSNRDKITQSES